MAATVGNLVGSAIACGVGRLGSRRAYGPRTRRALASCDRLLCPARQPRVVLARLMSLARTLISPPA
ncbi:MAG: hypothetical protein ACHQCF_07030 [Solirubrobacterales bacterium]